MIQNYNIFQSDILFIFFSLQLLIREILKVNIFIFFYFLTFSSSCKMKKKKNYNIKLKIENIHFDLTVI